LVALCRSKFSPEHGRKNHKHCFQKDQPQQQQNELNSIAAAGAESVQRSHITSSQSKRKITKNWPQKLGYASPKEIQQVLAKSTND
jgi:hypothetical protein